MTGANPVFVKVLGEKNIYFLIRGTAGKAFVHPFLKKIFSSLPSLPKKQYGAITICEKIFYPS